MERGNALPFSEHPYIKFSTFGQRPFPQDFKILSFDILIGLKRHRSYVRSQYRPLPLQYPQRLLKTLGHSRCHAVLFPFLLGHGTGYSLTVFPSQRLIHLDPVQARGERGGNDHIHVSSGIGLAELPVSRINLTDRYVTVLIVPADPMPGGLFDFVVAAEVAVDARHTEGAEEWIILQDSRHELFFVDRRVYGDVGMAALRGGAIFIEGVVGRERARGHRDVQAALVPNGLDDVLRADEIINGEQRLAVCQADFPSAWLASD